MIVFRNCDLYIRMLGIYVDILQTSYVKKINKQCHRVDFEHGFKVRRVPPLNFLSKYVYA